MMNRVLRFAVAAVALYLDQSALAREPSSGKKLVISFARAPAVSVTPMMIALEKKNGCAVDLRTGRNRPQRLVLIGEGYTEAVSCGVLLAVGRLPAPRGVWRIGFLYRAYSVNATVIQPAIIQRRSTGGRWTIDEALSQAIGEHGQLNSLPAISAWLKRTRR